MEKENTKALRQSSIFQLVKALGKDAIVQLANNILEKKYPALKISSTDYEITAWSNKTEVLVNFKRLIKFIPLGETNSNLTYDLSVNIMTKNVSPLYLFGTTRFYIPTAEELKKIEFVKKAFNLPQLGFDTEVSEEIDMYIISLTNDASFGRYHIDKTTGKERPQSSIQGSWDPSPEIIDGIVNKEPLIEIIK